MDQPVNPSDIIGRYGGGVSLVDRVDSPGVWLK
jgi:hypothetical protein